MPYSVLIIGCGAIAGGYDADRPDDAPRLSHAGAIEREARNGGEHHLQLVACVDPDDAVREAFAARWSVPRAAPDLASLGAQPGEFDLVIIASPTRFHAEHLEAVLALKPRAVICEKPLAEDLADAERLAAAYEAAGIPLGVNYLRRWVRAFQNLPAMREEYGMFDNLVSAVGYYGKGIVHNGGHMVDILQFLLGPLTLQSVGPARFDHWDDDPSVSAILTAPNGAPVHLVAGDARAFTQFEIVLTFANAEIAIRDGGSRWETRNVIDSPSHAGYRVLGPAEGDGDDAMAFAMQNLVADTAHFLMLGNSLDSQKPLGMAAIKCTARDALSAQRLCEEIRRKACESMKKDPA